MKLQAICIIAAASLAASPALAQSARPLSAHLTGPVEKPKPGDPDGMGHATIRLDTEKNQVCYDLMVENIAPATMAHIHKGGADVAGPVAVPLNKPDASGKVAGCATVDAAVVKDIGDNPGGYYVNVHNAEFPAGAIRGQISR